MIRTLVRTPRAAAALVLLVAAPAALADINIVLQNEFI